MVTESERYMQRTHARGAASWALAGMIFAAGAVGLTVDALAEGLTAVPHHALSLNFLDTPIPSVAGHVSSWLPGSTNALQQYGVELGNLFGAVALSGAAFGSRDNVRYHLRRI